MSTILETTVKISFSHLKEIVMKTQADFWIGNQYSMIWAIGLKKLNCIIQITMKGWWLSKLIMEKDNVLRHSLLNLYYDYLELEFLKHTSSLTMCMSVSEMKTANSNHVIFQLYIFFLSYFTVKWCFQHGWKLPPFFFLATIHQLWYKSRMLMPDVKIGHLEDGGIIIWSQLSTQCMWATLIIIKLAVVHAKISI